MRCFYKNKLYLRFKLLSFQSKKFDKRYLKQENSVKTDGDYDFEVKTYYIVFKSKISYGL